MLVDKFKEIAEGLGWFFNYGDYHWQNLNDFEDDTELIEQSIAFLLLWKDREKHINDFNVVVAETFEGEFIMAVRSRIDDADHNSKYEQRIKQIENKTGAFSDLITDCDSLFIQYWKETEVENALDTNVDGIKVKFRIRHDL